MLGLRWLHAVTPSLNPQVKPTHSVQKLPPVNAAADQASADDGDVAAVVHADAERIHQLVLCLHQV